MHHTRSSFLLLVLITPLLSANVSAADYAGDQLLNRVHASAHELKLATHPTWLKLLHVYQDGAAGYRVDIVNDDFYLTRRTPFDPQKELRATLDGFFSKEGIQKDNAALRCRFPARYHWLKSIMPGPFATLDEAACPGFDAWSDLDAIDSLSVLQVSGYLGNPASAFGHLLLRVNKSSSVGVRGLQDIGVNFGARIPDGENSLRYIVKGLFGGYTAGFTDKEFYAQDHVYSSTEFRDMWAYELKLERDQLEFLVYHLWELINARFQYFFLRKNCAYHLAELLELVMQRSFNLPVQPWYLPVSLFHQLTSIDEQLDGALVNRVTFIPSLQRDAYAEFEQLTAEDSLTANQVVRAISLDASPGEITVPVLNFLLAYIDYKQVGADENTLARLKKLRQAALLKRLALPGASAQEPVRVRSIDAPATGPKSRKFALSAVSATGESVSAELQIAPFAYDILNNNKASLVDSQFKLGELTASVHNGQVVLRQFDLIRLEKMVPRSSRIDGEGKPAWRTAIGVLGKRTACVSCSEAFAEGGIGQSLQLGDRWLAYGFVDARVTGTESRAGVSFGSYYRLSAYVRLHWQSSWFAGTTGRQYDEHVIQGLFNVQRNVDIQASYTNHPGEERTLLGMVYRW